MSVTGGASGTGNGVVQVGVSANANASARTGTLTIAGVAVPVTEAGAPACSVSISPDRASFTKDSAEAAFDVGAPDGCQWSASSQAAWITLKSGSPGSGNGTVRYAIETNREPTSRTGTISVGERTFTVTQAGDTPALCSYSLSTKSLSFVAGGGTQSVTVATPAHCTWDAVSDSPWLSVATAQGFTGPASVSVIAVPNTSQSARTGSVTIAGQPVSVTQEGVGPPPPCTYTVSPVALTFGSAGGSDTVTVTTGATCSWTATDDRDWITITSGTPGIGNGTVHVNVAANADSTARTGTLTVAGQAVAVQQAALAPCSIDISPASASYSKDPASGNIAVTAPSHCAWTASSGAAWVTITSGVQGTGSGTIAYAVAANTGIQARSATISVANRTFAISQLGDTGSCEYLVQPVEVGACMTAPTLSVSVTTQAGCTWTASAADSWITLQSGQAGVGSGTITFKLGDNYDDPRQGVVMVRWPTITAGQNVRVSQAGCRYGVSTGNISMAAGGGTGNFMVLQQSDPTECGGALQDRCVWTAVSDVPWITITSSMPRAGDNPVLFTVAPNGTGSARTGRITVRDKVVVVTQAGN
jgi:hypothetical protein